MKIKARELHYLRLGENISLEEFADEMQTTFPRHVIQDYMETQTYNSPKKLREEWLKDLCAWLNWIEEKTNETEI